MPHKPRKSRGPLVVLLGVPLLLVLYVLSIGPAAWLVLRDRPRFGVGLKVLVLRDWLGFYSPMFWVTRQSKTAEVAVEWYVGLWVPEGVIFYPDSEYSEY